MWSVVERERFVCRRHSSVSRCRPSCVTHVAILCLYIYVYVPPPPSTTTKVNLHHDSDNIHTTIINEVQCTVLYCTTVLYGFERQLTRMNYTKIQINDTDIISVHDIKNRMSRTHACIHSFECLNIELMPRSCEWPTVCVSTCAFTLGKPSLS